MRGRWGPGARRTPTGQCHPCCLDGRVCRCTVSPAASSPSAPSALPISARSGPQGGLCREAPVHAVRPVLDADPCGVLTAGKWVSVVFPELCSVEPLHPATGTAWAPAPCGSRAGPLPGGRPRAGGLTPGGRPRPAASRSPLLTFVLLLPWCLRHVLLAARPPLTPVFCPRVVVSPPAALPRPRLLPAHPGSASGRSRRRPARRSEPCLGSSWDGGAETRAGRPRQVSVGARPRRHAGWTALSPAGGAGAGVAGGRPGPGAGAWSCQGLSVTV